jgi:hypothetical protein
MPFRSILASFFAFSCIPSSSLHILHLLQTLSRAVTIIAIIVFVLMLRRSENKLKALEDKLRQQTKTQALQTRKQYPAALTLALFIHNQS